MLYELSEINNHFEFASSIDEAISISKAEIEIINESLQSISALKPDCDKIDYALAASSGALCGIIDIFLVGKPSESPLGEVTDEWTRNRVNEFAKFCGWGGNETNSNAAAIRYLERIFKVPYDQTGIGLSGNDWLGLTPSNHHFKSLAHHPSILGLFFSILDQFQSTSHFVAFGETIIHSEPSFEMKGNSIAGKIFWGIIRWFGHLMSDVAGSSGTVRKGNRGMGIPSPLWSWTNEIIAIKNKLKLPVSEFDKQANALALKIFEQGYDARFQLTQAIPVLINELLVRFLYSFRRFIKYCSEHKAEEFCFQEIWNSIEPFHNPTVKRMLTVAHGTFCVVDIGDATARAVCAGAGHFNPVEFFLRLNLPGAGRFTISLYGETKRGIKLSGKNNQIHLEQKEKRILEDYLQELYRIAEQYDDRNLINFVTDLRSSNIYRTGFEKTVKLAEIRKVPASLILRDIADIDSYFRGQ